MRHRKSINHLGRTSAHRKAMLSNMASSLILHKRITTTTAKAKALRSYVEPLLTKSKDDTTHSRRVVFSYLKNKYAVSELFREVSPKIVDRPGGYTRILKTGNRLGDNADMCIIELVDYNENMLEDTAKKTRSTRRRRGSGKAKTEAPASAEATTDEKVKAEEEEKKVEAPKAEVEEAEATTPTEATADKKEEEQKVEAPKAEQEEAEAKDDTQDEETVSKAEAKDSSKAEGEEKKTEDENPEDTDKEKDNKE